LPEFAVLNPPVRTVEESRGEFEAARMAGQTFGLRFSPPQNDLLYFRVRNVEVNFALERNTKFVDRIKGVDLRVTQCQAP
jgi:hypothetical protein